MEGPSSSTPLVALVLLLLAPLVLARELGARGSHEQRVRSPLMLTSDGDGDGDGAVVPLELDAQPGVVGRPGGRAPPAPKPSYGPRPLHEPSPSHRLGSSPGGVSGRQGPAPPPPKGNPSPHYRRSGPAAGVLGALRAFLDALVRYVVDA